MIPFLPQHPDHPEVLVIERGEGNRATENIWHSDVTWRERPSLGSALRSREVPEVGGDTLWADAELAYETLSTPLKRAVEGLEAEHSIATSLSVYMDDDTMHEMLKTFPPVRHPVVRTHPETGRKSLHVNLAHTMRILDVPREDSRMLLRELANHFRTPELQCRFRWTDNAIAFWDNRSTQHYAGPGLLPGRSADGAGHRSGRSTRLATGAAERRGRWAAWSSQERVRVAPRSRCCWHSGVSG